MHIRTQTASRILGGWLLAVTSTLALAQAAAPFKPAIGTQLSPAQVYGRLLSRSEREFVSAAEAMPADKYAFAPAVSLGEFQGVRTFGQQIKHVAETNYELLGGSVLSPAEEKAKSAAIEKLSSKAEIVQALKDSFAQAHTYVEAITPENAFVVTANGTRAGQASLAISHVMDHYGQMVVYLRMNGIVPPASRGRM